MSELNLSFSIYCCCHCCIVRSADLSWILC